MKPLTLFMLLLLTIEKLFSQTDHPDLETFQHKYVTFQAWELIKHYHPEVQNTAMHRAMKNPTNGNYGDWNEAAYDGNKPWELGTILTGSFREDEEDPVYCYCGEQNMYTTYTHFWNADEGDTDQGMDNYEGANEKMFAYWGDNLPGFGGYRITLGPIRRDNGLDYSLYVRYSTLAKVYKNPLYALVDAYKPYSACGEGEWTTIPGGIPLVQYLDFYCGMTEVEANVKVRKIVWEIVGRMCHLIQDMGTPAHVHNDSHPWFIDADYYEYDYLKIGGHFLDKNYLHAISQGVFYNEDPIININNLQNPIRTITYLTNQLADRFPSDDGNADNPPSFTTNPNTEDAVFIYNQLQPKYISLSQIITEHFGNNPPYGFMQILLNESYVYSIRATAAFLWYVYNQFEIIPDPLTPHIVSATQYPIPICKGNTGTITCNMENGQNPNNYSWTWVEKNPDSRPAGVLVDPANTHTNVLTIINPSVDIDKVKEGNKPPWHFYATATNSSGSYTKQVYPYVLTSTCYSGCPWLISTDQDTNYNFDNNLLHMSQLPQNQGQFITDKYVLKTQPGIFDGKIKLDLVETSIDSTLINSIKLYSVQHPLGSILGVTANNELIYFDSASVIQNDRASLFDSTNNYSNITDDIKFHNPLRGSSNTNGDSLFHIFAEFNKSQVINNPAVISYLQRGIFDPVPIPAPKDIFSGNLFINNKNGSTQYPFVRRENPDIIITPLTEKDAEGSVDSIQIAWDKSFKIKYAAVASLNYTGISVSELPLVTAFHTSNGDVLTSLLSNDNDYTYISPNAYLTLEFSSTPIMKPQVLTDYVVEINGQVIYLGNNKIKSKSLKNPNQNITPTKYSLSQNYPNPFNPVTKINFALPKQGMVTLKIYDVLGREVRTLVNEVKSAGNFSVDFNASEFSSGVYFYRLESNGFSDIKRMVLIK